MSDKSKLVEKLAVADLATDPVWQFVNRDGEHDMLVIAAKNIPVNSTTGRLFGTQVRLANDANVWSLIGNIDAENPKVTEHFLTLSIECCGKWFHLARYHDFDRMHRGPDALSLFLGLHVDDIFPIAFDVRSMRGVTLSPSPASSVKSRARDFHVPNFSLWRSHELLRRGPKLAEYPLGSLDTLRLQVKRMSRADSMNLRIWK